jgi:hypothetical protein
MTHPRPLFALSPGEAEAIAADPWKWHTFQTMTLPGIVGSAPVLVVLALGVAVALVFRRRLGNAARPVLLGCLVLGVAQVVWPLGLWAWAVFDPSSRSPGMPADLRRFFWTMWVVRWPLQVAGVWWLARGVLAGRFRRSSSEGDS